MSHGGGCHGEETFAGCVVGEDRAAAPAGAAEAQGRTAPTSGTTALLINAVRIYDAAKPERFKRFSGTVVSGAFSGPFVIDTRELVSVIGMHFRRGGAFPFFGPPANELADAHFDLEAL